jgi:Rrf2 family protein
MRLQISSQLAIFALLELAANPDRQLSVAHIGYRHGASSHHLAKVMHVLNRAGLVRAVRGAGGGYQFTGNARRTTLLDVIRLLENPAPDRDTPLAAGATAEANALSEVLGEVDDLVRATLGSITLATMLKIVDRHRAAKRSPVAVDH